MLRLPLSSRVVCGCLCWTVPSLLLFARPACAKPEPTPPSQAEPEADDSVERVSLATSLVTPIFGAYYLEANVRLAEHWGLLINASTLVLDNRDWHASTGTVGAGASYNWQGRGLRGWYTEVIGEIMFSSWTHEPSGQKAPVVVGYTAIAGIGYRFIWDAGPMLDLGAGAVALHFPSAQVTVDGETIESRAMTQYYPGVKVGVGWAF